MSSLMDLIGNVPQRDDYHKEGPVGVHTRMVRRQLQDAVQLLQKASSNYPSLSNLDTSFTEEDFNLLRLGAWLHDLGKVSATTINGDQIRSPEHHLSYHFNPVAKELQKSPLWAKIASSSNFEDKKLLWFLVKNHMEVNKEGLNRKLSAKYVGADGKYRNDRKLKLLLTLILMDRTGRIGGEGQKFESPEDFFNSLEIGARKQAKKHEKQSNPLTSDPLQFLQIVGDRIKKSMATRRLSEEEKQSFLERELLKALQIKSQKEGLGLSDDSVRIYVKRYLNS